VTYNFPLFNHFFGLAFRELLIFSPKILIRQTTAVTIPVLEFSIAISLALIVSGARLVALIGRVSVNIKWMPLGCSNLRRLSAGSRFPVLPYTLSWSLSRSLSDESRARYLLCFLDLFSFFSSLVNFSVRYAIWLESSLPVFLQGFLVVSKYLVGLSIVLLSFEMLRHSTVL